MGSALLEQADLEAPGNFRKSLSSIPLDPEKLLHPKITDFRRPCGVQDGHVGIDQVRRSRELHELAEFHSA